MKILRSHLTEPQSVEIKGEEDWLEEIYALFPTPKGKDKALLAGKLDLAPAQDQSFSIAGRIDFAPYVNCSRCSMEVTWPIAEKFEIYFEPEEASDSVDKEAGNEFKDIAFESRETSTYEPPWINLADIVREQILLALPSTTIKLSESGDRCLDCGVDVTSDQVYGEGESSSKDHPFAVLQDLKH